MDSEKHLGSLAAITGAVLAASAAASALALGGVETLAFAPAEIALAGLAVVVFWRAGWPRLSWPASAALSFLLFVPAAQMIPLPESMVRRLSPARAVLAESFARASQALPVPSRMPLSVNPFETKLALLRLICYVLVFLIAYRIASEMRPPVMIGFLIALGIAESVYGIVQYLTDWNYYFLLGRWVSTKVATGTYVNRNHFAGLLEMILPFAAASLLHRRIAERASGGRRFADAFVSEGASRFLIDLVFFTLICVGIVFSGSRMGVAGAMAGILVVGLSAFVQHRRRLVFVLMLFILAIPAGYLLWVGSTEIVDRFQQLGQPGAMEQDRLPVWRDTITLIRDYPATGTGLGTYAWINQHYQTTNLYGRYEHAHSDYLEFAADLGIPGAFILFVSLWALAVLTLRRAMAFERSRDRILAAGCAGALCAILIHSITDFNLQIPANAFVFSWIAGTAAALVHRPRTQEHLKHRSVIAIDESRVRVPIP